MEEVLSTLRTLVKSVTVMEERLAQHLTLSSLGSNPLHSQSHAGVATHRIIMGSEASRPMAGDSSEQTAPSTRISEHKMRGATFDLDETAEEVTDVSDTVEGMQEEFKLPQLPVAGSGESILDSVRSAASVPPPTSTTSPKIRARSRRYSALGIGALSQSRRDSQSSHASTQRAILSSRQSSAGLESGMIAKVGTSWPSTIRLRHQLLASELSDHAGEDRISSAISVSVAVSKSRSPTARSRRYKRARKLSPLDPDSWLVFMVDWARFLVLLYDILLTPMVLAWNVRTQHPLVISVQWLSACYWLVDCILNFATGFYHEGDLVTSWNAIARHYVRTWFFPDICLLLVDWFTIIIDASDDASVSDALQIASGIRCLKLVRLRKMVNLVNNIAAGLLSREGAMRASLLKIPFALLIYNHLVSCVWGALGRWEAETGTSWLDQPTLEDESVLSQYLVSLHWTIAQMTPGPMGVSSITNLERVFNLVILVFGLLYGSIIISQFSGHIMQITVLQRGKTQKLDAVRLFLRQRGIRRALSLRVQKQVHQRLFEDVPLQVSQVPAFEMLTTALRQELLQELRLPPLLTHMLFRLWWQMSNAEVTGVCNKAVDVAVIHTGDQLFEASEEGSHAYCVLKRGMLSYCQMPGTAPVRRRTEQLVSAGTWFCEAALWSYWIHVGTMEGVESASELLVIDAEGLMREVMKAGESPSSLMIRHYGRGYHLRIMTAVPPIAPWPTDLHVPDTEVSSLVSTQVGIGLLSRAIEHGQLQISEEAAEALFAELAEEKCSLRADKDGSLERIVSVVALRLSNTEDSVLVQLGTYKPGSGVKAQLELPGVKRKSTELSEAALQRLLEVRVPGIQSSLTVESTKAVVWQADSEAYSLSTVYNRIETIAFFDGDLMECGWRMVPVGELGGWLGVDRVWHVDSLEGYYIYAWIDPQLLQELQSSERRREFLEPWLSQINRDSSFYTEGLLV